MNKIIHIRLNWWLVYGPPRCGTTYMARLISNCSKRLVGDWGLRGLLVGVESVRNAGRRSLDRERVFKDISKNILDNSKTGNGGSELDLVFKQAGLTSQEYNVITRLWGAPKRIIFCFREPSGYIASAQKKFCQPNEVLQERYCKAYEEYNSIGGECFEYQQNKSLDDYICFLSPLTFANSEELPKFIYKGEEKQEDTNQKMWKLYFHFKETRKDKNVLQAIKNDEREKIKPIKHRDYINKNIKILDSNKIKNEKYKNIIQHGFSDLK